MKLKTLILASLFFVNPFLRLTAQTVRLDASVQHQRISGFGAFVCSPQFGYNHMSTSEIKKVWGEGSTVGCNIMRLYIPIGRNSWSHSLQTAKTAKQMGLMVFASPWGQPAEWKTNGTSNAKNSDGTTGKLKRENWADYAQYLEDYVQYLRSNGVELDAISIQNEPDWPAEYAGCLWSAQEIAEFVKTYGSTISCKVMAPETLAVSDSYVNALNKDDVLPHFDIYGGHQYGGIQSAYKKLADKGKELWMTEYLINWNEVENNTRSFSYEKDVFNFFRAINTCMLGDFNAWIHYAAKRYYGPLGDGQRGTTNGVVTKRGYVMAHFARFVTGMTRIDATFAGTAIDGSAYLSQTGDTAVVVVANEGGEAVNLTVDLPFYTTTGTLCSTTKTKNFTSTDIALQTETCRPRVTIAAQSVATVRFVRSRERQHSDMMATQTRFDRIEDMVPTRTNFGTGYKMSGKKKTFDHNNPLISSRTNASFGYLELSDRFSQLVMEVKKVTSTMNYTSSNTTLLYVNGQGKAVTHDYGELDWSRQENFSIVLDLSPATLADGCRGLISLTCNNWSSVLTVQFGDVYLGTNYAAKLNGGYVADDSNVLDFSEDAACTSLDLTGVTALPETLPWLEGTNRVAYVADGSGLAGRNIVAGNNCGSLLLTPDWGAFRPATPFTADEAQLVCSINGQQLLMLPFEAAVPDGAKAFAVGSDLALEPLTVMPAHTPVLVEAQGEVTFIGKAQKVAFATSPVGAALRGTYVPCPLYAGDYLLGQHDGQWGLIRQDAASVLKPFGVYASLGSAAEAFIPLGQGVVGICATQDCGNSHPVASYDLQGRRLTTGSKGLTLVRMADGQVRKVMNQ